MLEIDKEIINISNIICANIKLIDFDNLPRALIAQNILGQSRNLVEYISAKIYGRGKDIEYGKVSIHEYTDYIKRDDKYSFLREFHSFLQESKSHYTPDNGGAERLALKYYHYYLLIRDFMKEEYGMDILENLEKFPCDTDDTIQEYHEKIAEIINALPTDTEVNPGPRMYVHKVVPFAVNGKVFYEVTLTPASDNASKFDRFVCFSSVSVPSHYSLQAGISHFSITVQNKTMPIDIITNCFVSVRPCELNNYASLFGIDMSITSRSKEYIGMMNYLTRSGASFLEIVQDSQQEYEWVKDQMFAGCKTHQFEDALDRSRDLIIKELPGCNVIRYLLHTLNNKIIRNQHGQKPLPRLSYLYLKLGCIPFDTMPYATSLIQHNPDSTRLYESISSMGREHELLARYLNASMSDNARLYTPVEEVEAFTEDLDSDIEAFNSKLYYRHQDRCIEKFGQYLYVQGAYDDTEFIIKELRRLSEEGLKGYSAAIDAWLAEAILDSEEKENILRGMFIKSRLALIYGAAGTGKTYLINQISRFFDDQSKLYLANTNPAVENLRRNVSAKNCEFMTIRKYLSTKTIATKYDLLIIDECSMVSNADMSHVLGKVDYHLLVLAGDTYQIESIAFGNWFSMVQHFVPKYAVNVLGFPYRTNDEKLLGLWKKVRDYDNDLTEYIVKNHYASNLDSSIFEPQSDDEIILCLNYDGLYGINNINRFLQENNPNAVFRWGMWTFKVGDPVLFNESERFSPVLYNNLKGKILNIETDDKKEHIWFMLEIDKALTELDVQNQELELLESRKPGKSVIRFRITKKKDSDEDDESVDETVIPFQVAYAVSIHKAQGLEYNSVKIIITKDVDEMISHNIFYTAITRSRKHLKIYWSPETQHKILESFETGNENNDAAIFAGQSRLKMTCKKNLC